MTREVLNLETFTNCVSSVKVFWSIQINEQGFFLCVVAIFSITSEGCNQKKNKFQYGSVCIIELICYHQVYKINNKISPLNYISKVFKHRSHKTIKFMFIWWYFVLFIYICKYLTAFNFVFWFSVKIFHKFWTSFFLLPPVQTLLIFPPRRTKILKRKYFHEWKLHLRKSKWNFITF